MSTIVWLSRARFVQRATWTAACFQASHQQRMKAFKRGESCVLCFFSFFSFTLSHVFITHKVSVCEPAVAFSFFFFFVLAVGFAWYAGLFVASKCSVCLCLKFGGTASPASYLWRQAWCPSGGVTCGRLCFPFLPASFVRSRWLIYRLARRFASFFKRHI